MVEVMHLVCISPACSRALATGDLVINAGQPGQLIAPPTLVLTGGADSASESDSVIAGGAGNDVIVLGSHANSNDTAVIDAANNGIDTIIGFEAGAGADVIQLAKGGIAVYESMTLAADGTLATTGTDLACARQHCRCSEWRLLRCDL